VAGLVTVFQETCDWEVGSFPPHNGLLERRPDFEIRDGKRVRTAWNDACFAAMRVVPSEKD
jgi:hypothetical protein